MYYQIIRTTCDWVEADSEEEAMEKWNVEDTIGCWAEDEITITEDPDFYD